MFIDKPMVITESAVAEAARFDTNSSSENAKNFGHFKYSLRVNKKNILGEYLRSLSQVRETTCIYTSNE